MTEKCDTAPEVQAEPEKDQVEDPSPPSEGQPETAEQPTAPTPDVPKEGEESAPTPEQPKEGEKPADPKQPEEDKRTKIDLGPVEGASIHLAHMQIQLTLKDLDKTALKIRISEQGKKMAEAEQAERLKLLGEQQKILAEKMKESGVPDGWNFIRNDDGSYTLVKPPPGQKPKG